MQVVTEISSIFALCFLGTERTQENEKTPKLQNSQMRCLGNEVVYFNCMALRAHSGKNCKLYLKTPICRIINNRAIDDFNQRIVQFDQISCLLLP